MHRRYSSTTYLYHAQSHVYLIYNNTYRILGEEGPQGGPKKKGEEFDLSALITIFAYHDDF